MSLLTPMLRPRPRTVTRRPARHRWTPTVEGIESRLVMSGAAATMPAAAIAASVRAGHFTAVHMLPLKITNVIHGAGGLAAVGSLGSTPFTAPLKLSATPNAADPTCPILNLHLQAIDLNLLGLEVKTSDICLDITAHGGGDADSGLLGDLLCGVSNLLNTGAPLGPSSAACPPRT